MPPIDESIENSASLKQDYVLTIPAQQVALPIPRPDWDYLRGAIQRIQYPSSTYEVIASAALGIAGSALVAALTLPRELLIGNTPSFVISWCAFGVFAFGGALSLMFSFKQKRLLSCTKDDVLAEMKRIEQRFLCDTHE
jgi:hypothetical protein